MSETNDQKSSICTSTVHFILAPIAVIDPLFDQSEFFDPRDLMLVKYEMLRRVRVDGVSVVEAAERFGFSRAGFYKTLSAFQRMGLVGLIPARRASQAPQADRQHSEIHRSATGMCQ